MSTLFKPRVRAISCRVYLGFGLIALSIVMSGCRTRVAKEPVSLTYLRLGWAQPDEFPTAESFSQQFTRTTGIRLRNFPVPETTLDQLALSRQLLEAGKAGPDVVNIDFIWSGALAQDLIDLQTPLAAEFSALEPQLFPGYTVNGRVVAIPYQVQVGILEYRSDLLRKYGYDHPPRTWTEMETMALRIQTGERMQGRRDFWGYVWQGAEGEGLTCNALEWQASDGGGHILEGNRTVSVNNQATIRAWQRAKRWIGWISPPSVIAFRESDSMNAFDAGGAAFNRLWGGTTITRYGLYRQIHWQPSLSAEKVGYTSMPKGTARVAGAIGGSGLSVSSHSAHTDQALELVRYLTHAEIRSMKAKERNLYHQYSEADLKRDQDLNKRPSEMVSRPSVVAGQHYEQVSKAYMSAVHAVLTGERQAPQAAGELERELVTLTGFRTGPPINDEVGAQH